MTGDETGDVARLYVGARMRAIHVPTRSLRRVERAWRRVACDPHESLGRAGRAAWAAARAELRSRGRRVPAADQPPRRWRRT